MVVGLDQNMHIGISTVLLGVALEHRLAQCIDAFRHVDGVALRLHAGERVVERLEYRQISGGADVAGIRREVEQHDRDLALGMVGAAHGDQLGDSCRQHDGALRAGGHVLRGIGSGEGAVMVAAVTGHALRARSAAENHRAGCAVELGNRHHDGALDRQQSAVGTTPLIERLKLGRMGGNIGHIERGEHILGCLGIVVGRPADQRETRERDHRIDGRLAVTHEKLVNCRAGVEAGRKGRDHPKAARFERRNHAIVMTVVAGQQIGPQHQHPDRAQGRVDIGRQRQVLHALGHARCHAGVIDTELRILHRRSRLRLTTKGLARSIGIAVDQKSDQVEHVFLRTAQPVLQRQEIAADILRGTRDELQHLGDPTQHLHLLFAAGRRFVLAAAAQFLEQRQRP